MRGNRPTLGGQGHQQGRRLKHRRVRHLLRAWPHHRLELVVGRTRRVHGPNGQNFHRHRVHCARIGPVGRRRAHQTTINFACLPASEDIGAHSGWSQDRLTRRSSVPTLKATNTAQMGRTIRTPRFVVVRGARAATAAPRTITAAPGARRKPSTAGRCRHWYSADGGPRRMVRKEVDLRGAEGIEGAKPSTTRPESGVGVSIPERRAGHAQIVLVAL